MKKKFLVLESDSITQIQMWLNQRETTNGGVVIETPMSFVNDRFIIIISYNAKDTSV